MALHAYILRRCDGTYYVGHTDDRERRIAEHRSGAIARYTSKRLPIIFLWAQHFQTRDDAFPAERKERRRPAAGGIDKLSLSGVARQRSKRTGRHTRKGAFMDALIFSQAPRKEIRPAIFRTPVPCQRRACILMPQRFFPDGPLA